MVPPRSRARLARAVNPENALEPTPERRSPSIAAFLSFLWPGLGHWYTRRDRAALLFALPVIGVVLIVAVQAVGGVGQLASLLISPSSALTIADPGRSPRRLARTRGHRLGDRDPSTRRLAARSVVCSSSVLVSIIIAVTHIWAASVAWAFYDAGNRIFVGAEGADAAPRPPIPSPSCRRPLRRGPIRRRTSMTTTL